MLLKGKIAVIYGAAGAVGSVVSEAFAAEGARVYLAGRTLSSLESLREKILSAGGWAEATVVDVFNKETVESHLEEVVNREGRIDISFNLMGMDDIHGISLSEMDPEDFCKPITNAMKGHFITGTAAARLMAGGGVILTLTANAAKRPYPNIGGFGVACAAIEGFCRQLAYENGSKGVRVVGLRSAGSPDSPGLNEVFDLHAANEGLTREEFDLRAAADTMLKRLPLLKEVAQTAVLMASDKANIITGAVINITCGELTD